MPFERLRGTAIPSCGWRCVGHFLGLVRARTHGFGYVVAGLLIVAGAIWPAGCRPAAERPGGAAPGADPSIGNTQAAFDVASTPPGESSGRLEFHTPPPETGAGALSPHRAETPSPDAVKRPSPMGTSRAGGQTGRAQGTDLPELPGLPEIAQPPQGAADPAAQLRREAYDVAEELATAFPNQPDALAVRGWVYHRLGNTSEASRCWNACVKLDPRFAEAHFQLGAVALKAGKFAEAQECFQRAVQADPKRADARLRLAEALLMEGKAQETLVVVGPVLAEGSAAAAEARYFSGRACLVLRQYVEAQRHFEEAIRLAPAMTHAYHGLATALARLGRSDQARRYQAEFEKRKQDDQQAEKKRLMALDDVAELRAAVARTHAAAAQVFGAHGQLRVAEKHWRRAAALDPQDTEARLQLAILFQQQGRLQEALVWSEELVERQPRNAVFLLHMGVIHAEIGRLEAAEGAFRRAVEAAPDHAPAHAALAQLYLRAGRNLGQARHHAERAVHLAATAPNYALLAAVCRAQGDVPAARRAIQQALRLEPHNAQIRALEQSLGEPK